MPRADSRARYLIGDVLRTNEAMKGLARKRVRDRSPSRTRG